MLHKVCCRQAQFGAVKQKVYMISILTLLPHRIGCVLADLMAV
jgi:hypothetical protein